MIYLRTLLIIQCFLYVFKKFELENAPSSTPDRNEEIKHVVYGEGKTARATYESIINVVPNLDYSVKVEVLRNDLGSHSEKVSKISFDGVVFGDCNPDGEDYDCTFFDCKQSIQKLPLSSKTGSILVALTYQGHSWDCDCDKETWTCSKENQIPTRTPMTAVARITLSPIIGNMLKIINYPQYTT